MKCPERRELRRFIHLYPERNCIAQYIYHQRAPNCSLLIPESTKQSLLIAMPCDCKHRCKFSHTEPYFEVFKSSLLHLHACDDLSLRDGRKVHKIGSFKIHLQPARLRGVVASQSIRAPPATNPVCGTPPTQTTP